MLSRQCDVFMRWEAPSIRVNPDMFVGNLLSSSGWMLKTEQESPVIKEKFVLSPMA
jgi:hypothetical protein